jgi:hypothetical protein
MLKKILARIFTLTCVIFFGSIILKSEVRAIAKFNTGYQVYYKVSDNGVTHVTFVITQKNNLSIVYATEYGISLNETKIANLKIKDEGVEVVPVVTKNQNQTLVSFPFAKKVVGKDKIHNFTIEYDTSDIVSKQGNTWQINIPRFETDENVSDQTAILTLPANFPQPAYIDPKPDIVNGSTYYFSSKILANKPISAIFGKNQYYKGKVSYFIKNTSLTSASQSKITLIPNTAYQEVFYESITPFPTKYENDQDGNLIATYDLKPNQELDIEAKLFVKTDFLPKQIQVEKNYAYTESTTIWNYNDNIFSVPELKNLTSPKSVYDFVANKLQYDYQKINAKGTVRVPAGDSLLNYISAICTDYTDLFVALARKAKIPARELEGLAISENPDLKPISAQRDILHAWPEYYDETKKQWIQVDPTWGSTTRGLDYFNKLDFNHIVFAIHGSDPFSPPPAGAFKKEGSSEKMISFEAIEEIDFPKEKLEIKAGKFSLTNSNFVVKNINGTYISGNVNVAESKTTHGYSGSINIPPFGNAEISLVNKFGMVFLNPKSEVIIEINGRDYSATNSGSSPIQKGGIFAVIGAILGIITLITRSLLLRRRK